MARLDSFGGDEAEMARRRLTAAAYGFSTWEAFRQWRRDHPREYRQKSRELTAEDGSGSTDGDNIVDDLLERLPRNSDERIGPGDDEI